MFYNQYYQESTITDLCQVWAVSELNPADIILQNFIHLNRV